MKGYVADLEGLTEANHDRKLATATAWAAPGTTSGGRDILAG